MHVWAQFLYWSEDYPNGPNDRICRTPWKKEVENEPEKYLAPNTPPGTNVFANLELQDKCTVFGLYTGYIFTDVCNKLNTTINDKVKQMNILCVLI